MRQTIALLFYRLRTSFWFLPMLMTLLAIALSQASLYVDREMPASWVKDVSGVMEIGPQGSRMLMSTIAGSMMTVASLVFSMTLIALTMTSSQFGPRLLTHFMRDRVTQAVLGIFLATFVYALITLGSIEKADEGNFIPHLSVATGMVLAIANFCVLIYFIHHISSSIQADAVIARATGALDDAIESYFDEAADNGGAEEGAAEQKSDNGSLDDTDDVSSDSSGYIQVIDHEALVTLAEENDLTIHLHKRAGHFIIADEPVAAVAPAERLDDTLKATIKDAFTTGRTPTMVQDPEFAMNSIVEIALRALSPGINDTHTALVCIDNISAALAATLKHRAASSVLCDRSGEVRVFLRPLDFAGLLKTAFDEIRQTAPANVGVNIRLIEALVRLAPCASKEPERAAIREMAEMICRGYERTVEEPNDRADIEHRIDRLTELLGRDAKGQSAGLP